MDRRSIDIQHKSANTVHILPVLKCQEAQAPPRLALLGSQWWKCIPDESISVPRAGKIALCKPYNWRLRERIPVGWLLKYIMNQGWEPLWCLLKIKEGSVPSPATCYPSLIILMRSGGRYTWSWFDVEQMYRVQVRRGTGVVTRTNVKFHQLLCNILYSFQRVNEASLSES